MTDVFVARVMSTDLHAVTPETLVEEAAGRMLDEKIGSLLVIDEANDLRGILTRTDFVRIVSERRPKDETPVSAYMTTNVVTAHAQDTVREAAEQMLEAGVHHLPVVDETEGVIGIVTTTDLTAYLSGADVETPA